MHLNIDEIRSKFPSLATLDDGQSRIYFDNPAGTQVPQTVADAVSYALIHRSANQGGSFRTSRQVDAKIRDARVAMADLLNAPSANEIIFGQSMTALTFHLARSLGPTFRRGDEIVLSQMDHDANVYPWMMMARDHGLEVRWLRFDTGTYEFDLQQLDELVGERTRLVCIGGASNLLGTAHDIKRVCAAARDVGALSFIDAVQSVPHIATDVQDIGCDFLACSAYKFFGPHMGILWGRKDVFDSLQPYQLRPAPQEIPGSFEPGTPSFELMAGVEAAVHYFDWIGRTMAGQPDAGKDRRQTLRSAMDLLFDYEQVISTRLVNGLSSIKGVQVRGITDPGAMSRRVPTVAFTADESSPAEIADELADKNIFVWHGHNYAVEVVRALGLADKGGVVRVGPVHYNTLDEVDTALNAIEDVLS